MAWDALSAHAGFALSNGDYTATDGGPSGWKNVRSVRSRDSGKWYFELEYVYENNSHAGLIQTERPNNEFLDTAGGWSYYSVNGLKRHNGGNAAYGPSWAAGDIIGVAVDLDAGKIWWSKNGVWVASGSPADGTNQAFDNVTGTVHAAFASFSSDSVTLVEDLGEFTYAPPDGFKAWNAPDVSHRVAGTVKQDGSSVSREIRVIDASNGELLATADSIGGSFDIGLLSADPVFVQAIPAEGYRPLIKGPLTPAEIA